MEEEENYLGLLGAIRDRLDSYGFPYVFVGGVISSQIRPETQIGLVYPESRTFSLYNAIPPLVKRENGSVRDVDIVALCPYQDYFGDARADLKRNFRGVPISIEGIRYPYWPERKKLTQFVVGTDADGMGRLFLAFDDIKIEVDPETLAPWGLITEYGTIPVFNPVTHLFRYLVRVPSGLKPKDKEKRDLLSSVAWDFIDKTVPEEEVPNFFQQYDSWSQFLKRLIGPDEERAVWTSLKIWITRTYWNTVGEFVSNGRGGLSRFVGKLSDRFSG